MTQRWIHLLAGGSLALAVATTAAIAQQVKVEGIIMHVADGQAMIRTDAGEQMLAISQSTDIAQLSGARSATSKKPASALVAGLPVTVEGRQVGSEIQAETIRYTDQDYRVALQIQAGLSETNRSLREVRDAVSRTGEFDVKVETSIFFGAGNAVISDAGKQDLQHLADEAKKYPGYFISVLGYADPAGNPSDAERLSSERAQNVINFLKRCDGIQPGRVLAASAMGAVTLVGATPDPAPDVGARRVTARVVVSKAQLSQP